MSKKRDQSDVTELAALSWWNMLQRLQLQSAFKLNRKTVLPRSDIILHNAIFSSKITVRGSGCFSPRKYISCCTLLQMSSTPRAALKCWKDVTHLSMWLKLLKLTVCRFAVISALSRHMN